MRRKVLQLLVIMSIFTSLIIATPINKNTNTFVPSFSKYNWGYDDFIFTSNKEEFYTYKDGVLHHWQFVPVIKHLNSIIINFFPQKENAIKPSFVFQDLMYLVPKKERILFYRQNYIEIWDLKKRKKILSQKISSIAGVMTEEGFLTIDEEGLVQLWSTDTLKIVKSNKLIDPCINYYKYNSIENRAMGRLKLSLPKIPFCKRVRLFSDKKNIYNISHDSITKISLKTLSIIQHKKKYTGYCKNLTLDKKHVICDFGYFNLKSFTNISREESKKIFDMSKIYVPEYFLKYQIFGSLEVFQKIFKTRDKKEFQTCIQMKFLEKDGYQNLGYFYHNNRGDWYFQYAKTRKFDSNLPLEKLKMRLENIFNTKRSMSQEIYNKFYKTINIKDVINGKRK